MSQHFFLKLYTRLKAVFFTDGCIQRCAPLIKGIITTMDLGKRLLQMYNTKEGNLLSSIDTSSSSYFYVFTRSAGGSIHCTKLSCIPQKKHKEILHMCACVCMHTHLLVKRDIGGKRDRWRFKVSNKTLYYSNNTCCIEVY